MPRCRESDGAALRPTTFQPTFQKHAGQICGGVQVHVTDPEIFQPYAAYLRLIAEAAKLLGDDFAWRPDPYEFIGDVPAVDLLTGGPEYRAAVEGRADLSEVLEAERAGARAFRERRREWLIY